MKKYFIKLMYLYLKKDMIKKLRENHGTQFVDNVMETFKMPTNLTNEYLNSNENDFIKCNQNEIR